MHFPCEVKVVTLTPFSSKVSLAFVGFNSTEYVIGGNFSNCEVKFPPSTDITAK